MCVYISCMHRWKEHSVSVLRRSCFVVCVDLSFQCACGIRCNNNVNGKHLCSALCGSVQVWHPFVMHATECRSWGHRTTYSLPWIICVDCVQTRTHFSSFFQMNDPLHVCFFVITEIFYPHREGEIKPHIRAEQQSFSTRQYGMRANPQSGGGKLCTCASPVTTCDFIF